MVNTVKNDAMNAELIQSMSGILGDMQGSVSSEVSAIRGQSDQVKLLLIDAVGTLHDVFSSIHSVSDKQMKVMTSMMMEVVGADKDENIFQKAEQASAILTTLVDTLLLSSKNNLRALTSMDVVHHRIQKMASMLDEQEALVEELYECAEADTVDVIRLRKLTRSLREKHKEKVAFAREAMVESNKTHRLIDKIASKDMDGVFASKLQVEEILNHFFQINEVVTQSRIEVNLLNAEQRKNLGSAIRALQFEDISTQSLGHTDRHLDRMQGMLDILADGMHGLDKSKTSMEEYVQRISAIHIAMIGYHQALQLEDSNPVSQESMDEGDIDLF